MIGRRDRGAAWAGGIAIAAAAAIGLAWWIGSSGPEEPPLRPRDREAAEAVEGGGPGGAPSDPPPEGALEPSGAAASPEVTADLAARLARALDGGIRPPGSAAEPSASVPPAPPQPRLRLDRPPTASEQREFAGRLHDWIILRRDELRRRLAELEESGQGGGTQAERVRWELRRLDEHEPAAARHVEELAERVRREEEASAAGAP